MKRVIITGVSSGLGYEIAKIFLKNGFEIIGISRNKPDLDIIHLKTDLTKEEEIIKTTNIIREKYSENNALILCAGGGFIEEFGEINIENINSTLDLNLTSNISITNKLLPSIKNKSSDILVIGATIGYKGNKFMPVYSIAKWGLRGFVENIRDLCKGTKSRVLLMSPGGLNTESNIGENGRETIISKKTGISVNSLIDPIEVAKIAYNFLNLPKNIEISEIIINRK